MRYMVLIGHDEKGGKKLSAEQHEALFSAYQKYEVELKKAGVLLGGDPQHECVPRLCRRHSPRRWT